MQDMLQRQRICDHQIIDVETCLHFPDRAVLFEELQIEVARLVLIAEFVFVA